MKHRASRLPIDQRSFCLLIISNAASPTDDSKPTGTSATLTGFRGIERFPLSEKWLCTAQFRHHADGPKTLPLVNGYGLNDPQASPGALHFNVDGNDYQLDIIEEDGAMWVIFVSSGVHELFCSVKCETQTLLTSVSSAAEMCRRHFTFLPKAEYLLSLTLHLIISAAHYSHDRAIRVLLG